MCVVMSQWGFPDGSVFVKNPPANTGDGGANPWVGQFPWRRKWQKHSSILAWEIPWTESGGVHKVHEVNKSQT